MSGPQRLLVRARVQAEDVRDARLPQLGLSEQFAEGHVGLASQRVRVKAAGGSMRIASAPGEGTGVAIRVPL